MTMHRDIRSFRPAAPTIRRRLTVLLNRWVAAMIAHREREAARFVLGNLNDRALKETSASTDLRSTTVSRRSREDARGCNDPSGLYRRDPSIRYWSPPAGHKTQLTQRMHA
jgi:hypothetical protein